MKKIFLLLLAGLAAIGTAGPMGAVVSATDVRPEVADQVIALSKSFNIDAQVVGHIEEGKKSLTIKSEFGTFDY